jgi:S-adenosylmethionine/arginine decarboxylase-like enzyme
MLDCQGMNDNITSKTKLKEFVEDLVVKIKMEAVGKPIIKYLLAGHSNSGYSLVQLIQTSNIAGHFMDQDRTAYIDIFSCKKFNPKTVETVVKKHFGTTKIKSKLITRTA